MIDQLNIASCLLLFLAAMGIGLSKSGFAGMGMFHVVIFAFIFGAREATGLLLPMLIVGDMCAIKMFGKTAQWKHIQRLLPPTAIGVILGWLVMGRINDATFRPLVGGIILTLTFIQATRMWRPQWFDRIPHERWFAWSLGLLAGVTTMLANAAGPVMALYFIAVSLPKLELVGTSAWFFLIINLFKVPFSFGLDLINLESLAINAVFAPAILPGMLLGQWLVKRISQRVFDTLLLAFTGIASLRLIGIL